MLLEGLDKQDSRSDLKSSTTTHPKTTNLTNNNNQKRITSKSKKSRQMKESSDSFEEHSAGSLTTRSSSGSACATSSRASSCAGRPNDPDDDDDDLLDESRSSLSQDFIEMSPKISRDHRNKQSRHAMSSKFVPKMQSKATSTPASDSFSTSGGGSLSEGGVGVPRGSNGLAMDDDNDDNENNNYEAIPSRTIAVQCDLKASTVKRDGYLVESATDLASMQASSISSTRYGFYKLSPEAMEERRQLARSTSSRNIAHSSSGSSGRRGGRAIGQMDSPTSMSELSSNGKSIEDDDYLGRRDSYELHTNTSRRPVMGELNGRPKSSSRTSTPAHLNESSRPTSRLDSLPRRPKTALSYVSTSRLRDDRSGSGSSPDRSASGDSGHRRLRARAVSQQVLSGPPTRTTEQRPLESAHSDSSETVATTTGGAATNMDRYRVPCNEEVLVSLAKRTSQVVGGAASGGLGPQQQVRNNGHGSATMERRPRSSNVARSQILASPIGGHDRSHGDDDDDDNDDNVDDYDHNRREAQFMRRNNETFKRSATISSGNNRYSHNNAPQQQMPNEIINESPARQRHHHHHYQDDSLNQFNTENMVVGPAKSANGQARLNTNANRITNDSSRQPVRYGSMSLSRRPAPLPLIDRSCNNLSQLGGHHLVNSNKQRRTSTGAGPELGTSTPVKSSGGSTLTRAASRQQLLKQQAMMNTSDVESPLEMSGGRSRRTNAQQTSSAPIGRSTSMRQMPTANGTSRQTRGNRMGFEREESTQNYRSNNDDDDSEDDYGHNLEENGRHFESNAFRAQQMDASDDVVVVVESDDSESPMTKTWANPGSSKPRQISPSHQNLAAPSAAHKVQSRRNRRSHSMRDVSGEARDVLNDAGEQQNYQNRYDQNDREHQEEMRHYQAKQFQYNWESASDELSSMENNPHTAQQLFSRAAAAHQHQLDYDSQHRLNESGLPETNSLASSSSSPKFYHNAPASCLGLSSGARQQTQTKQGDLNGSQRNSGYATTGRQRQPMTANGTRPETITGRAMSQQSLVRPTMPLSSGRRLRRQTNGSGGSSGGGSELGGSSLSLMSSRFLGGSRYENAHTRTPVVMYIPQANSKQGSMSDLNGGRSTSTTRRSSRTRLTKAGSSSQDNMRRKSSLSRHGSDNESQSSMLRTLVRPKGSRSSSGANGSHYASKRSSRLRRRAAGDHSNGEDEDMDGVGQLASEIDSYKFRRRYSVPKDAKINWFAKLRQRVISSK